MNLGLAIRHVGLLASRVRPDRHAEHELFEVKDHGLATLGLRPGDLVCVDGDHRPRNGDLVLVELLRGASMQRLVRRYFRDGAWVALGAVSDGRPANIRRHFEARILGVVDRWRPAPGAAGPA